MSTTGGLLKPGKKNKSEGDLSSTSGRLLAAKHLKGSAAAMAEHISEEWRSIDGFEGLYEVSDLGSVRSVDRTFTNSLGQTRFLVGRTLKPFRKSSGYLQVGLHGVGPVQVRYVHRLVLATFSGACPQGMEVRHLDGDPENNRLENLRYGTHRENMLDQVRHGTNSFSRRTHCPYGHPLLGENLVNADKLRGGRKCRSCDQARAFFQHHRDSLQTFQEVSDVKYAAIMGKAVPNG